MGQLIDGEWHVQVVNPKTADDHFERKPSTFRNWITSDGPFTPESNRYVLYVSLACPWAHRAIIYRAIKELEDHIPMRVVHPVMGELGWSFNLGEGVVPDDINHVQYLKDLYIKADPHFTGRVTVPVLWDTKTKTIVNNESADIIRMFNSAFNSITGNTDDYYPNELKTIINQVNDFVYMHINNGVYKAGFATSQLAYEQSIQLLFKALVDVDDLLKENPFMTGKRLTEADWRLFTTMIRFDAVYYGHFKCNVAHSWDFDNIFRWMKGLFFYPKIAETINFDHIQTHYYASHRNLNPSGIVPVGPKLSFD